jgi:drug/metabolite transporter (DMT)-like permease
LLTGVLAGLAAGALWGLVFVAPRMVTGLTAVDFSAGRFLSYGAMSFFMLLVLPKVPWPTPRQALSALGLSILGFTGYYLLLVYSIMDAGTEVPSLIIGTIPIWMMLLGKPAGLRWQHVLPGLVLTLLGLGLMVQAAVGGQAAAPVGPHFWRGLAWATAAMVIWTAFGLINAAWLKKHPEVSATTWAHWLGLATGLGSWALWGALGTDAKVLLAQQNIAQEAILCIATGIGSAWLATILWNVASQRLSASLCGQLIVSETIFALAYAFVWDGHQPTVLQIAACIIFVCGILASIRAHR